MKKILIIGGSDAGISAGLRAREVDPSIDVAMVVADRFPNYSICGLPFYISGETPDRRLLAHRSADELREKDIRLLLEHWAMAINPANQSVMIRTPEEDTLSLEYDELIIATGAVSIRPDIPGMDLPGVFLLRWMGDGIILKDYLDQEKPGSAVVIGGGYIGLEMADSFTRRGMRVTVVEYADTVLTTVDPELGIQVRDNLERHGVQVATGTPVSAVERIGERLLVMGAQDFSMETDIVLVTAGARPNVTLAAAAGVDIGGFGAIRVNSRMETGVPHIFAAGDCVQTWHRVLKRYGYMPLGTTAHKQGRVAGENAAGGEAVFQGSIGTQVVKIFDLVAARTGLKDAEAKTAGFDPLTVGCETWDHKVYYPGAGRLHIRMTGDRATGRLLGAQILGQYGSEISKRIDILAAAIFNEMNMDAIGGLDLSYTPPLSSPWDPVQAAAQEWSQRNRQRGKRPL